MRFAALASTLAVALFGCEIEATVGSVRPIVLADARSDAPARDVVAEDAQDASELDAIAPSTDAGDASIDASAGDAADAMADVRQRETSVPESPLCGAGEECPLGRQCSRTLCQPLWSGCDEVELCNGLDDDCDGVRDNDVDCGGGDPCPTGLTRCGSECVDLRTDRTHCGRCDRACSASTTCMIGHCR